MASGIMNGGLESHTKTENVLRQNSSPVADKDLTLVNKQTAVFAV